MRSAHSSTRSSVVSPSISPAALTPFAQRGTAFVEDALIQGFAMLSRGTELEGARLEIVVVDHIIDCPCGIERPILAEATSGSVRTADTWRRSTRTTCH